MTLASSTRAVSAGLTADACVDGFMRKEVPDIPVVVWGQCGGLSERRRSRLVDEVAADVADSVGPACHS